MNYKNKYRNKHYDRVEIAIPKGKKEIIKAMAASRKLSISSYILDLIEKDQASFFDTMEIAIKYRTRIDRIKGTNTTGYDIYFKDGHHKHLKNKKQTRDYIISYLRDK